MRVATFSREQLPGAYVAPRIPSHQSPVAKKETQCGDRGTAVCSRSFGIFGFATPQIDPRKLASSGADKDIFGPVIGRQCADLAADLERELRRLLRKRARTYQSFLLCDPGDYQLARADCSYCKFPVLQLGISERP